MWKSIGRAGKEIFFPKRCYFCKNYGRLLCDDCKTLFDAAPIHQPDRAKKYLADIYSACSYENKFVKKMIHGFKYEPFYKELGKPLAQLVVDHFSLSEQNFDFREFVIIPVPLAKKRARWRGFNQAEIIARELGCAWQAPVAANCLAKIAETKNQADLGQVQRLNNIKEAFACANNASFKNKPVIIIDDIITTGATMNECGRILKRAGARSVIGISVARADN